MTIPTCTSWKRLVQCHLKSCGVNCGDSRAAFCAPAFGRFGVLTVGASPDGILKLACLNVSTLWTVALFWDPIHITRRKLRKKGQDRLFLHCCEQPRHRFCNYPSHCNSLYWHCYIRFHGQWEKKWIVIKCTQAVLPG